MIATLFAGALAVGLLAFAAWTIRIFVTSDLQATADRTSWMLYQLGRALCWVAARLIGGALLGGAASAVWKAVGGP